MNLSVSGHHVTVTPAMRRYLARKIGRVLRHFNHLTEARVILSVNKVRKKAEVTLHVRGKDIHCESVQDDLYAAIDLLADKLDRQVLRYKDRNSKARAPARRRAAARRTRS
jgi:putative sigma-54 modulation protein